ncbi:hemagglutinin protein-like protein [Giardia lamblia P15]|uniref:Hemagglutinin protein-like protein n=1 Tax=Giardia intestinalis (strain P15) TaxID=658858 RepID=E1EZP7_GIAIA|nr:hemagglutinin protein-like protein [Giardia lamblia P15]
MTPVQNLNSSNMTSVGKSELLTWLANSAGYASISDWGVMTDGVAVMRCIKKFWPITCRGIITGGFNWTITEEEEKRRNWRVIEQCLKAVTVPIEIFEFGKIAQGKKKACYHFLVMMYFIGAIHSGTAKNIAFAYPIEAPLKEFLQSERVVKVAQMDAQKRRQQRKPKCYSTTPSNLTMIDADECDDIFEPLNFSTKDLVNIFADADLCTSPSTKTSNRHHPSGLVHLQLAGEKVKNVLSQNIATVAKTTRDGEEYSAMSPCKSVSSSISKPPISPEEHPDTAKCFKTRESSATSLQSRESVTTSEGSTRKHRSSQDESFRSCPQFITPSHSISEDHEDVAKEEPHAVHPSPRKPSPSDSFAAIKAAATAAVLNASRGPMESSTSSVIHQLPEQVSVPSVQNHAIRRLIAGSKPSVSGSPRPVSEKTPLSRNDGSLRQASARSRPSTFRTSTVTHSGCSTGACPSYSPSVSRYIRLNSPSAGLSRFHDNGAHYQESGLKINYLYDSKKEATSSISSICSSMNNSSAATLSLLQTDEKAQAYVEKVGTMLQQLNSKAANTIEVKTATSSKPPHMAGLALLSFSNSDTSDGVSDLQIGPDAYAADSSKEATTATAPQRTSSANSNLRSSMLSHTPSRSSTTACFSCTSSEEVSTEIDPKTSSIKSPDEQKSLADYEKGPSVPKNLPRWPSKKVTKGISPIAPTGLSISTTSSSNQTHGPDITNSLLNDTKLTLTSSNTVNASNVVSMYSSDCPTSILSSGVQGSGISLVTSSNGSMAPTNTSMPDMEKATQSVKYLGPFSEKPAEATLVHDLSSKPSMVNLLHSQFGAFPVAVDSSTSIPMVVSSFNSNYSQPPPPPASDPKSLITNLKKAYQEASLPNVLPSANQHTLSSSRTNGNLADCGSSIIEHTQNLQSSTSFPDNISLSLNVGDASRYSGAHLIGSTKQCLPSSTSDTFLFASSTSGFGLAGGTHSLFTDLQEVREGTANILKLTNNMDEQHASSQSTPHSINTSLYTSESNHNIASTESLDKHKVTSGRPQPSIPILLTSGSVVDRPSFIPRFQAPPPASVGQSQSSLDLEQAADIALIKSVCNKFNDMEELSRQKDAQIDSYGDLLANLEEMFRISKEEATRIQEIYDKKIKFLDEFSTKKAFIIAHALHTEFLKNKFSPNGLENRKGLEDFQGMLLSYQNTVAKYIDELKAFEASLRDDLFSLSKFEERYNDLTNNKYIAALKAINTELALKLGQVTEELAQLTSLSMNNALSNVSPIADMHRSGPEVDSPDLCFATGRAPTAATEATSGHLRNPANLSLSSPQTTQILRPGNLTIDTFVKTLVMNSQLLMKMEDTVSELDRYKAHSGLIDPINMELATLALASSDAIASADPERALKNYEDNILHIIQLLKSNANHYLSQDATAIIIKHLGLENAVLPSAVKSMIDQHRSLLLELTRDGSINATYPAASQVANVAATLFDENSIATILKENNIDNTERNRFLYLRSVAAQLLCSENVLSHRLNASQLYLQNIAQFMQKYAPAVAGGILADADSRERIVSMVSADIDRLRNDYGSKLLETQAAVAQLVRENESLKAELLHYKQIVDSALTNAAPVVSTVQQLKHRDALFFELLGLYEKLLRESNGEEEQLRSYLNDIAFFKAQLQRSAINYEQFAHDCTNGVITDTIHNYLHAVQLELDNRTEQLAVIKNNLVTERSNTDLICEHSRVLEDRIARLEAENYSLRLLSKESSMHADLSSLMASTPLLSY